MPFPYPKVPLKARAPSQLKIASYATVSAVKPPFSGFNSYVIVYTCKSQGHHHTDLVPTSKPAHFYIAIITFKQHLRTQSLQQTPSVFQTRRDKKNMSDVSNFTNFGYSSYYNHIYILN